MDEPVGTSSPLITTTAHSGIYTEVSSRLMRPTTPSSTSFTTKNDETTEPGQ